MPKLPWGLSTFSPARTKSPGRSVRGACIMMIAATAIVAGSAAMAAADPIGVSALQSSSTIFSNGTRIDRQGGCDSGPEVCGGSGTWTVFDDFSVTADAVMTGFTFDDALDRGEPDTYRNTTWSVWMSSPIDGTLKNSGTAIANVTAGAGDLLFFAVNGLNVPLKAGTLYWLGTSNRMAGAGLTSRSLATGNGVPIYLQSDGAMFLQRDGDTAFTITGAAVDGATVPEPEAWILLMTGGAFLLLMRHDPARRRALLRAGCLTRR